MIMKSSFCFVVLTLAGLAVLSGCATGPGAKDPLEPFNRTVWSLNEAVDGAVVKPLAETYQAAVPEFARGRVRSFFSNLNDTVVLVNSVLQLKGAESVTTAGRLLINSTIGVFGLFDVATEMGMEKGNEDFGQTLGKWGVGPGPYVVLPLLGPSNARDVLGVTVDIHTNPLSNVHDTATRNVLLGTVVVDERESLLSFDKIIDAAAVDRYSFVRDAYLQRRRSLVWDGAPPREREEFESDGVPSSPKPQAAASR